MKKVIIVTMLLSLLACTSLSDMDEQIKKENDRIHERDRISIDACVNQGGIPIYSSWDNSLKDCKFKK